MELNNSKIENSITAFNNIIDNIKRILMLSPKQVKESRHIIDEDIKNLVKDTFDDWEEKIGEYSAAIHAEHHYVGVSEDNEQGSITMLILMRKYIGAFVNELEYLKSQTKVAYTHHIPSISVSRCASSEKSFEVHILGKGFPPDVNTMTQVMFPNFTSIGLISFRTDARGNLRSFFGLTSSRDLPFGRYIANVFVGEKTEKILGTAEAWTTFSLPYTNQSILTLDPIPNVPWGQPVTVKGKLSTEGWEPMASQVHAFKLITFTGSDPGPYDVQTDESGMFSAEMRSPTTVESNWKIQAHFFGDSFYQKSDSRTVRFNTVKHDSLLELVIEPKVIQEDQRFNVTCTLVDTMGGSHLASRLLHFSVGSLSIDRQTDDEGTCRVDGLIPSADSGLYIVRANFTGDLLYCQASAEEMLEVKKSIELDLLKELNNCPKGIKSSRRYEAICEKILNRLFVPPLLPLKAQSSTELRFHKRDLVMRIPDDIEKGFWSNIQFFYRTLAVIVECKNYNGSLPPKEIDNVSKYFHERKLGNFGLLITRTDIGKRSKELLKQLFSLRNIMIIPLTDSDLAEMLKRKKGNEKPESVISDKHFEFREIVNR